MNGATWRAKGRTHRHQGSDSPGTALHLAAESVRTPSSLSFIMSEVADRRPPTNQNLAAAGRRQAEIARLLAAAEKQLKERVEARKGKGSGRVKKAEQRTDDALHSNFLLGRGIVQPNNVHLSLQAQSTSP